MTDQPSEGRDNFAPANEINEESFMPADGYGAEPEKRRSLASHHRSHRHHSSSGSGSDAGYSRSSGSYSSSDAGYGRSAGDYSGSDAGYGRSAGDYSGSDAGYGRSAGGYSESDASYGRSQGGYNDGYSAGYEAGYRSSSHHSSRGDYSDGYSAGYEAGLRSSRSSHSHHHSSRYSDGYDDGYESGHSSHHHSSRSSSHHSSRSSSSSGSKPGRLASHHRSRHHHHHHHHSESAQTDQNYVSTYEALPIETGRIGIGTEVETVDLPLSLEEMKNLPYDDQAVRLEDIRYADRGGQPEDVYYADRGGRPEDVYYADRGQRPEDVYYADRGGRPEDVYYADREGRPEDVYYTDSSRGAGQQENKSQEMGRTPGPLASTIVAASAINPPKTHDASTIESSGSRRRRKKQQKRKTILGVLAKILIVFIVLIIASIGGLVYLRYRGQKAMSHNAADVKLTMEKENTPDDVEAIEDDGKTITYKGEKYRWNDNISTILFLGSDRTVEQQEARESVIGINGQADTILLGVIDNKNKKISFINVNRDTMTNVAQYTPDGDYAGDKQMQICLAYSYGKDNEEGCKMMASTVSNLLYGIPIDAYARISYDAVPMLNDSVGGVTVKVLEDMSSADPALVKDAKVTLTGSQALRYIRWRNKMVTETNELRMARQKQYFYAFMNRTIEATRADFTLPLGLYNNAKPYMTTDITPSRVTYLTSKVLEYGVNGDAIHSVAGSSNDGASGLVEFHADDVKLYEMILNTFYNKVK
ncbi:MAG: LCP family protein [Lachnospiraceae bacterium]|nr:LCP family protein [Lachnospiraceae bacterium]